MKLPGTLALLAVTLIPGSPNPHGAQAAALRSQKVLKFPEALQGNHGAPVVLRFTSPANGSVVEGPDVQLRFALYSAAPELDAEARELTVSEVKELAAVDTMCFRLLGFGRKHEICSPLHQTAVNIKDALHAKWHTISASILLKSSSGMTWEVAADSLSVFVSMAGYDLLEMCGESACLDTTDLRSAYFDSIYRNAMWGGAPGSTLATSASVRSALAVAIKAYGIRSMLDAPCGDATWINLVSGIEGVRYTGADISEQAIYNNIMRFDGSPGGVALDSLNPEVEEAVAEVAERGLGLLDPVFLQADLVEGLPLSRDGRPFDLVFVRDLMLHLPARHNLRVLRNIQASGARFLMASTFVEADENQASDTFVPPVGHSINLSLPPYCLPEPIALVKDHSSDRSDLRMGLWELTSEESLPLGGNCSKIVRLEQRP